jgi:protein-S-isoprenylcysteine O-methyltransferase Ste14
MIYFDIVVIVFLFLLFALSHTWLASLKIKKSFTEKMGDKIAFYRLFYNLSSLLFFVFFYFLSPKPDVLVYDLHYPFDIVTFAIQVLAFIGLVWAASQTDLKEFVGISQVKRYLRGEYRIADLDEKQIFRKTGAFKLVRHPIYLFSILFLGFRPTMDLFYLVMFVCLVVYFYIGSIYEEKKLVEIFGDEYRSYQKAVPRLIPFIK